MQVIKGILSFPALFTPKVAKGANEPKFSCTVLIPPNDPQIAQIQAEVDAAKLNTFPSGYTGTDECFGPYDVKYQGKEYYDPQFSGWYVFSCSAKAEDKPAVVDLARQPVIDPSVVYPGSIVYVNAGISGYVKGKGGIGGWLNGVMVTGEEGQFGRLDNKPSVDHMFSNVAGGVPNQAPAVPQQPAAQTAPPPAPNAAPVPPQAPAAPVHQMTAAANGATYEQMIAAGWTDESLIQNGMMLPPGGVQPSFAQ